MKKHEWSIKEKIVVLLLLIQFFATIGNSIDFAQRNGVHVLSYLISILFEAIPCIAAIILLYYEQEYSSPLKGNYSILRIWEISLIWIQPILSLISYASAGMLSNSIFAIWIGSTVFIIICTVLLIQDGKITKSKLFLNQCATIIDEIEKDLSIGTMSCKQRLLELISAALKKNPINEYSAKQPYYLLANYTYNLLSSGEFHIYAGELNPLGMAKALQIVHDHCAKWLLDNQYMSQEEYDEHNIALRENIKSVG